MNAAELQIVTAKSQADKAINSLKGLLTGIMLDKAIASHEVLELKLWAVKHNELIKRNPFNEFINSIESLDALSVDMEVIDDLYWLCQKYEGDNYYYNAVTADLQTLQGLCHGILSDGEINEQEVRGLQKWLENNTHLNSYYPYDEIRSLILSVLADNKVDEEEIIVLKAYFKQFAKIENSEIQKKLDIETEDVSIFSLCTSEPEVVFEGKTFCTTGVLKRGTRERLNEDIAKLGGTPTNTVSKKTDYLIIGDHGNPAWAFACYGRKVEKALQMRKEGHTITLIHEFDFGDILDDRL